MELFRIRCDTCLAGAKTVDEDWLIEKGRIPVVGEYVTFCTWDICKGDVMVFAEVTGCMVVQDERSE